MSKVNYTFYTKKTGVEFLQGYKFEKAEEGIKKSGRVNLRFFTLSGDPLSWKFIMDPAEAFALSIKILEVIKNGGNNSLSPHQFEFENQEDMEKVISTLYIESWENNNKKGYAVKLTRRNETINVPMDAYNFLFLSELLKKASVEQTWTSYETTSLKSDKKAAVNTKTSALENELSEDITESNAETSDEPVQKPSAQTNRQSSNSSGSNGKTKFLNVPILAISEDRTKIQIKDNWYQITKASRINTELIEGSNVNAYYNDNNELTALYAGRK